ncbi:SURF1 family cytochrome oxidase biogenesis protein [Allokutzneria oryzae]|uniref:SURF1-like protein n=1 Tax=Allokutzneria oryzae TaxID=1378989 RepID=A0ABV6A9L3_9PSEU
MRWKFLLRPGWLALIAGVLMFSAACFVLLGPWQFRQHDRKQTLINNVTSSETAPVVPYERPAANNEWRQVRLTGTYLPEAETVARLRTVLGEAAFEVLTPMRLTDGRTVLINRGFERPINGTQIPDYDRPPAGEVTVVGRLRLDGGSGETRETISDGKHKQVYSVSTAAVTAATGVQLEPGFVQLNPDQPGVRGALPLPNLDSGPHFSYALQWYGFGIMALLGLGYFAYREANPEQPRKMTVQEMLAQEEGSASAAQPADRYGSRR